MIGSLKAKVIEEYLATGCTKMFLLRKYNIQFKSAIQTWMRKLGYSDPGNQPQRFKFTQLIFTSLAKQREIDFSINRDYKKELMNWNVSLKMKSSARKLMQE